MQHRMGSVADNKCRDLEMFVASFWVSMGMGGIGKKKGKNEELLVQY